MEDVRAALDPEEPDYERAAQLGEEALPHLLVLVEGEEPMLASKAAYLAGLIGGQKATEVVQAAAHSNDAAVRVAAASSTEHLPGEAAEALLVDLVVDLDPGVRKVAHRAVPARPSTRLEAALNRAPAPGEGTVDAPAGPTDRP